MSKEESSTSSFIPSRISTQLEYPSISHNHTYNKETTSVGSSIQKAQSTIDYKPSQNIASTSNTYMKNIEPIPFSEPNTK